MLSGETQRSNNPANGHTPRRRPTSPPPDLQEGPRPLTPSYVRETNRMFVLLWGRGGPGHMVWVGVAVLRVDGSAECVSLFVHPGGTVL